MSEVGGQLELFTPQTHAREAWADDMANGWFLYTPEHKVWFQMGADLAAKYAAQGCLVRLAPEDFETDKPMVTALPPGRRPDDFPEGEPRQPPFAMHEIVWSWRAAEFRPEVYGSDWEVVANWLRTMKIEMRPEDYAEQLSLTIGRWGGGYDLEAAEMNRVEARPRLTAF